MSKTYTKSNLIHSVAKSNGYSKQKSKQIAESLLEIIKRTLESAENAPVSGFGKFIIKDKRTVIVPFGVIINRKFYAAE